MNKDINTLRDHLFAALDGLADKEKPMEIERAKAIADVARVVIDSAKAETELLKVTGARGATTFIPSLPAVPNSRQPRLPGTTAGVCQRCGGRLEATTNGLGALVDRCRDCGCSPAPALQGGK